MGLTLNWDGMDVREADPHLACLIDLRMLGEREVKREKKTGLHPLYLNPVIEKSHFYILTPLLEAIKSA
jgi:hypothetical protein